MPAKNPRLTITLKPSLSAQLRRISELTGNSQSALISDLLDGSAPVFDRLIVVLEAAQLAAAELKGNAAAGLESAQAQLESQLGLALDTFEDASRPILDAAEVVKRRSAGAGGNRRGGVSTPISNRGVRSTHKTPKTSLISKG